MTSDQGPERKSHSPLASLMEQLVHEGKLNEASLDFIAVPQDEISYKMISACTSKIDLLRTFSSRNSLRGQSRSARPMPSREKVAKHGGMLAAISAEDNELRQSLGQHDATLVADTQSYMFALGMVNSEMEEAEVQAMVMAQLAQTDAMFGQEKGEYPKMRNNMIDALERQIQELERMLHPENFSPVIEQASLWS